MQINYHFTNSNTLAIVTKGSFDNECHLARKSFALQAANALKYGYAVTTIAADFETLLKKD